MPELSATTPKPRILVVDDESTTRNAIVRALSLVDYLADGAASGGEALARLDEILYDLMLLDLRMPEMDGVEVMARARVRRPNLLVIVLTAYATVESAIAAVRAGASDYLLKPCSVRVIEASIARALALRRDQMRRQKLISVMAEALHALQSEGDAPLATLPEAPDRFIRCGPVTLDRSKCQVAWGGGNGEESCSELTANETEVLGHLMRHPDQVFSCRELARASLAYEVSEREAEEILRPYISRLRKKVEPDPSNPLFICTVRGKGYYFASARQLPVVG
jgi:DNA-binding response OmpR family regulator